MDLRGGLCCLLLSLVGLKALRGDLIRGEIYIFNATDIPMRKFSSRPPPLPGATGSLPAQTELLGAVSIFIGLMFIINAWMSPGHACIPARRQ